MSQIPGRERPARSHVTTTVGSRAHRSSAVLSVTALAASALIASAGSAGGAVTSGGNADPEGRPAFFRDSQGIALVLCTNAVQCEPADPADPLHGGYFGAEATAGPFTAIYGVETAAGEDAAGNPTDTAVVANVARFRAEGVRPGATYRVRGPWGTVRVTADDRGRVDAVRESGGETGTVQGGHVQTFLRRLSAPAGFLGNLETAGPVTGSPTGFNRVSVTGPGVNATTRSFVVNGQLRPNTAMGDINRTSLRMGNIKNARPVQRVIRYRSFGTEAANVDALVRGRNASRFAVADNCASVAPRQACSINVTYRPRANRTSVATLVINDNGLAAPRRVSLRGTGPDSLAPRLASFSPGRGQSVGVRRNVSARFNEPMRGVRRSSFMLVNASNGNRVGATVSRVRKTDRYVLNPRGSLAGGTTYRVRLNGGKAAARDRAGNPVRDRSWRFSTR